MLVDRRQALKILAAGIFSAGAGGGCMDVMAASPFGRPRDAYMLEHLPPQLQPDRKHPHLPAGIRQTRTCQDFIRRWQVPGNGYSVGGLAVRAVAPGIVHFVGQGKDANRNPMGYYVRVAHDMVDGLQRRFYPRITLYRYQAYRSTYYYLSGVEVAQWQSVKRGQTIGTAAKPADAADVTFKLVLEERGNPVNPDQYGAGHGFMQSRHAGRPEEITREEMNRRLDAQVDIVRRLNAAFTWGDRFSVFKKIHCYAQTEKFFDYPIIWSTVEQFRYLSSLYRKDPGQFPSVSKKQHDRMARRFYKLQPVVLTLPFD